MLSNEQIQSWLTNIFDNLNFNRNLGLAITECESDKAEIRFAWDDKLMGNPMRKILHGGVTASVLDNVGGILAIYSRLVLTDIEDEMQLLEFSKCCSTIDLRTDYLRPGFGDEFIASARLIRSGSRVCVCRMELHNQNGDQIAFGTGTYLVG